MMSENNETDLLPNCEPMDEQDDPDLIGSTPVVSPESRFIQLSASTFPSSIPVTHADNMTLNDEQLKKPKFEYNNLQQQQNHHLDQKPAEVRARPTLEETSENATEIDCYLKDITVYKLLDRSVGMITLDCGYHQARRSSLDVLIEVCCDYIRKISSLLRIAMDTDEWRDSECDFVDSLERAFHQVNIPSAVNLHQFVCKIDAIRKHRDSSQSNQQYRVRLQQQQQQQQHQP